MTLTAAPARKFDASRAIDDLLDADLIRTNGKVSQVIGTVIESNGPPMAIGETASIAYRRTAKPVLAEAVGFRDAKVLLMPLGELGGIAAGSDVVALGKPLQIGLSSALLGRVIDGLGRPLDRLGPIVDARRSRGRRRAAQRDAAAAASPSRWASACARSTAS